MDGTTTPPAGLVRCVEPDGKDENVEDSSLFQDTPLTVPTREQLRTMVGDTYTSRGSRQRNLAKSRYCNLYKVSHHGRSAAIAQLQQFFVGTPDLRKSIWTFSGCRLLCHFTRVQDCDADALITEFKRQFPSAYDRSSLGQMLPSAKVMSFLAELRREPESDEGSTADEGAPPRSAGFCGRGPPRKSDSAIQCNPEDRKIS